MKIKKVQIPIYFGYLHIVCCKDFVKACKKLKINTDGNDVRCWGAFCTKYVDKKGVIHYYALFKPKPSHSIIAHETVHIVNYIFDDRHIPATGIENDEPQAYLTGWVADKIYKAIKK